MGDERCVEPLCNALRDGDWQVREVAIDALGQIGSPAVEMLIKLLRDWDVRKYAIIALGKACELAGQWLEDENTRVKGLRDRLESELLRLIPAARINGGGAERLPNTLSIAFEFVEGEAILLLLSEKGICASSGSACTSGSLEPSHVLRAMGVPFTCAHGSIRFSLSRFTTDGEIDTVIRELPPIVQRLREISPFGRELLKRL